MRACVHLFPHKVINLIELNTRFFDEGTLQLAVIYNFSGGTVPGGSFLSRFPHLMWDIGDAVFASERFPSEVGHPEWCCPQSLERGGCFMAPTEIVSWHLWTLFQGTYGDCFMAQLPTDGGIQALVLSLPQFTAKLSFPQEMAL